MRRLVPQCLVLCFLVVSAVNGLAGAPDPMVEVVAHRGASHDAPENTLASVNLAWKQDADAVEVDIYLSKDGQIILFHDRKTDRIGGSNRPIGDHTFDELQQLDVGIWKSEQFRGERIPRLSEVLATIPDGKRLFIEIKTKSEILPQLKQDIAASGVPAEKLAMICFDYETIRSAKKLMPVIPAYWLSDLKTDETTDMVRPNREELIRKAEEAQVDGLDLRAHTIIDAEYVAAVKDAGLGCYVWTVNDPVEAQRLVDAGIDGITTDRPGFIKEALSERISQSGP